MGGTENDSSRRKTIGMSKMLLGRTGITSPPWRQVRKNFLTERLKNVPKEMVISPSSYFTEGGISQMTVLSLSSSFVVNLQWLRLQKSEAQNARTILFFSPFIFSYSCQKNVSFLFFPNCASDFSGMTSMYQGLDKGKKLDTKWLFKVPLLLSHSVLKPFFQYNNRQP